MLGELGKFLESAAHPLLCGMGQLSTISCHVLASTADRPRSSLTRTTPVTAGLRTCPLIYGPLRAVYPENNAC